MTVRERLDWRIGRDVDTATWGQKLAGVCFAAAAGWFLLAMMVSAALVSGYTIYGSSLGELGVTAESALVFNGSVLVLGVLTVVGGYLFYRSHETPWLLGAFALAGLGAFGAGVFTREFGVLHAVFALLAAVAYNLAAIGTGVRIRGPMVVVSVLLGALGLVFLVLLVLGVAGDTGILASIGPGGVERMIVYPAMLWLLVFGGYLLGARPGQLGLSEDADRH